MRRVWVAALLWSVGFAADAAPDLAPTILAAHNAERAAVGVPRLSWSNRLTADAAVWARHLARSGRFEHSRREERPGQGENLWMGTAGRYGHADMVEGWTSEKADFVAGKAFPAVSRTGKRSDVGHYTQMIWRETTEVGCAVASGGGWDYLVCRYSPPGNVLGRRVY